MKISNIHQRVADHLGNQRALDHPEEFLGPNWKDVLNFWIFLDTLTEEQWEIIDEHYWSLNEDDWRVSYRAARNADLEVINGDVVECVWWTAYCYSSYATYEIIGSHILKSQGKSLVFLPMFLTV